MLQRVRALQRKRRRGQRGFALVHDLIVEITVLGVLIAPLIAGAHVAGKEVAQQQVVIVKADRHLSD